MKGGVFIKNYTIELLLCFALISVLLAGSDGPAGAMARELSLEPPIETVISPPSDLSASNEKIPIINDQETHSSIIPVRITIPNVSIDAIVQPVGILKNGAMDVPKDDRNVGWLQAGYKPGENGNAVMAGHVDNLQGVAVFHPLHDMKMGDEVYVSDRNGKKLTFVVTNIKTYRAERAPIRYIFGKANRPKLNLITCTGFFDPKLRTHIDRLVVYTEMKQ